VTLISSYFVTPSKLTLTLLLRLSQLGIGSFNLKNRWLPNLPAKKIPLLHHKVAAFADFCAVMPLHSLVKGEAVFGDAAFLAFCMGEPACGIAEAIGFVG